MLREIAIRCALASYASAFCGFASLVDTVHAVEWISACLGLVIVAMFQAEKHQQVKYANSRR
jgi:hypothetical protein